MQKYELYEYLKIAGGTLAAVIFYSYLWKKNRILCLLMLAIGIGLLFFFVFDWEYWREYMIVNPAHYN